MIKKISKFLLIFLLGFLFFSSAFSNSIIPVEDAFLDINEDYTYYHELDTLYSRWIIEPESDNKFHSDKLLNRDEFVWIAVETSCKECISPNVSEYFTETYKEKPFFDVWLDNKYFYCVSDAKENNFVLGYNPWVRCNDWTQNDSESPFCTNNNIKLEEALAVVMRMWWIMTVEEADKITSWIENWQNYPKLALDLETTYSDWTVNSFYPYFKKALEYEVIDYDTLWNEKRYKLVEKKWEYLRPDTLITKQDFLKMAFVALKANSCFEFSDNQLALKIEIFEQSCNEDDALEWKCNISDLQDDENILDFNSEVWGVCEKWIDEKTWYIWRFLNKETWESITKYWKFIDNYEFLYSWDYKVFLRATDKCWNSWEVYNELSFLSEVDLKVSIDANPIIWNWPLEVLLKPIVNGWVWPYEYIWNFWDSNRSTDRIVKHVFIEEGIYDVVLTVIDSELNSSSSSVVIKVLDNICSNDSDSDWVNDCEDKCPLISWELENNWCPIFIKENAIYETPKCLENKQNSGFIFWNVVCSSCPCNSSIDFRATLRECDTVIPAITSPSEKDIYSRGKLFQILK